MKMNRHLALPALALLLVLGLSPSALAQNHLLELQAEYRDLYQSVKDSVIMVSLDEIESDSFRGSTMSLRTAATVEAGFVVAGRYVICDAEDLMQKRFKGEDDARAVLGGISEMWGRTAAGQNFKMRVVGADLANLLMVCALPGNIDLPELPIGDSFETKPGETVAALGNGFDIMLVDQQVGFYLGTLSEVTRFEPHDYYDEEKDGDPYKGSTLCFEGAVNPGDSGGPLLNMRGEVIGMLTSHFHAGRRIGSAVPSSQFRHAFDAITRGDKTPPAVLGFRVENANKAAKSQPTLTAVRDGGPADLAGLKVGDVVLMIDGYPVKGQDDIGRVIGFRYTPGSAENSGPAAYGLPAGSILLFTVRREGALFTREVIAAPKSK